MVVKQGELERRSRDLGEVGPEQALFTPEPVEPDGERRLLKRVLLSVLVVLLAAGALNVVVDPLYRWQTGVLAPYDGEDQIKQWAVDRGIPVQTMILGNSRALAVNPDALRRLTGETTYNGAMSFTSWKDHVEMADAAIEHSPDPVRTLVWVLTPEALSRPVEEGVDAFLDDVGKTFSLGELEATAKSLAPRLGISYHPDLIYRYDEATGRQRRVRDVTGWFDRGPADAERRVRDFYTPGLVDEWLAAVDDGGIRAGVEDALERWREAGISLLVVVPPYQPTVYRLAGARFNRMSADLQSWVDRLEQRDLARTLDLSRIDAFSGSADGFLDGVHLRGGNVVKLTRAIAEELRAL